MTEKSTMKVVRDEIASMLRLHMIHIEVIDGPDRGTVAALPGPEVRIGTGKECDLILTDRKVSRLHMFVRIDGGSIRVIDADSRNGTIVDSLQVRDAYARPDSRIIIGESTLRLRQMEDVVDLPLSERERMGSLLGRSVAMRSVFALLERIAPTDMTVLIEGETGTGKELVAEVIHEESARASGPFVVFDCSAVSATLIESELFGHMRGAFTGAVGDRLGAFEMADGGTLFLDEIGELPLDLQPKLLRALERRQVRRVGANVVRHVDVRFVAASNRSLSREVERGRFREDLFYRLAVVRVSLPPLRERLGDIHMLVRHFEDQLKGRAGSSEPLSEALVNGFAARSWPGNIRELRNAVSRALSLGTGQPGMSRPVPSPTPSLLGVDLSEPLLIGRERVADIYEKSYLEMALQQTEGNVSRAAEVAKVNRKFIQRAMKRHGIRRHSDPDLLESMALSDVNRNK